MYYCRYCGKKIPEEMNTCVACGKENIFLDVTEQKAKRKKTLKLSALVLAAAIVLTMLAGGIYHTISYINWTNRPEDIYYFHNYAVSEEKMAAAANTVVATAGGQELTNAKLQIFYWMYIYSFVETNGEYIASYGLNLVKPYDEQIYDKTTGMTWQQYFLDEAIKLWQRYIALSDMAKEKNFQMTEASQKALAGVDESVQKAAKNAGLESVDEFLQTEMGPCVTLDDYKYYLNLFYTANDYYNALSEEQEKTVTEAELDAWYKENRTDLKNTYGVTKESGNLVSVRHILIMVDTTGKDADGKSISTDEDWTNCEAAAQKVLDEYKAGKLTEERFGELAEKYSEDTGSNKKGGLYSGITKETNFVEPFKTWCMDESRQVGETGLVKTSYGYHVMYYVSGEPRWEAYCRSGITAKKCNDLVDAQIAENAGTVDYTKLTIAEFIPA